MNIIQKTAQAFAGKKPKEALVWASNLEGVDLKKQDRSKVALKAVFELLVRSSPKKLNSLLSELGYTESEIQAIKDKYSLKKNNPRK